MVYNICNVMHFRVNILLLTQCYKMLMHKYNEMKKINSGES